MDVGEEINSEVRGLSEYTSDTGRVTAIIRLSALPTVSSGLA